MIGSAARELERAKGLLSGFGADASLQLDEGRDLNNLGSEQVFFGFRELFLYAGLSSKQVRRVLLRIGAELSGVIIAVFLLKQPQLLFVLLLVVLVEYRLLKRRAFKRAEAFERDYTALLLSLASGVRTGLDPLVALVSCARLFEKHSVIRREIESFDRNINAGLPEEQAMRAFAASINHPDIKLFQTAFILARREGSSLAMCLQRLARVTRQRQSFRRRVRAAVAMQKLSGYGIAGCTAVVAVIQCITNMAALRAALEHPVGSKALAFGVVLIIFGIGWLMQIARSKI